MKETFKQISDLVGLVDYSESGMDHNWGQWKSPPGETEGKFVGIILLSVGINNVFYLVFSNSLFFRSQPSIPCNLFPHSCSSIYLLMASLKSSLLVLPSFLSRALIFLSISGGRDSVTVFVTLAIAQLLCCYL